MRILDDVLPAEVHTPDHDYDFARLVITTNPHDVLIYTVAGARPKLARTARWSERRLAESAGMLHTLVLESGELWQYKKRQGCNCNNPLRSAPITYDLRAIQSAT